jgi:glycosyltransferase involved in cell wall biosynthesis
MSKVTATMVTGGEHREWWAKRSLASFHAQTYSDCELLVINESGGTPWEFRVLPLDHDLRTREIVLPHKSHTVGQMRNLAKAEAGGDWVIQWDDDDWHHEKRIHQQMLHRQEGRCQVLFAQVRYSVPRGTAYVYSNPGTGISGTILHPKTDFLYPNQTNFEDMLFLLGGWEGKLDVLDNRLFPHLYIRFFHGENLNDEKHVMRKYAEKKWYSRWIDLPEQWGFISRNSVSYLRHVLDAHYDIPHRRSNWADVLGMRKQKHPTDDAVIPGIAHQEQLE